MNNKTKKKQTETIPGNDVLNGIERWIPEAGVRVPKQFKYCSPTGIWYKNKFEAGAVLSRAGVPESEWQPVPTDPFTGTEETGSLVEQAISEPEL